MPKDASKLVDVVLGSGPRVHRSRDDLAAGGRVVVAGWSGTRGTLAGGDEIGNGRFIVRYLGAERYLDVGTVAVLITLRQNLIAELGHPSTADIMMIDAAVIAYFNLLRVQGTRNLALSLQISP